MKKYVQTQYRHQCSNTDEYIDSPDGAMCACGKPLSKELRKEIDDLWRKTGMKEMGIKGLKKDDIVVPKDFPMGVSEWLRIGKKYGYYDYWMKAKNTFCFNCGAGTAMAIEDGEKEELIKAVNRLQIYDLSKWLTPSNGIEVEAVSKHEVIELINEIL